MMQRKKKEKRTKGTTGKSTKQWFRSVEARCALIFLAGGLVLLTMFCAASAPERYSLKVGSISHTTITATKDVVDEVTTEERRKAAANAVEPSYHLQVGASEEVMASLETIFSEMRTVQQYGVTLRQGETASRTQEFADEEVEYAKGLVTSITLSNYQIKTLLRASTEQYDEMVSTTTTAVENTLNTTIREGQVNQSISTILQIVGYKVETSLFQNILPTVLRSCVKPNMVIEQESTELAREKARDAVEPVLYLQGQNIIREGERVGANQLRMLRDLGLLEDNRYDLSIYGGAALMILSAMLLLMIMLFLLQPAVFHDVRKTSVIMVVMCLTVGLCVVTVKVINAYLVPVTMGAMLLTGLLGAPAGVAGTLSLSLIVSSLTMGGSSSYTAEMIHLMITSVVSGIVSVRFLRNSPQRVRMVICGFVVAIVNLVMMTAIGMLTSVNMHTVIRNAVWCMGGGIFSGVLAVGLQPVIETAFNLATPSKLMELANPNQPLLRRLLIEAPGTYHHSIIVANLSEAAAEKIGANPLLARAGAYFHDVGKLKRPLYFKENQMGENPHDRTDPYVSAAIVTSHTRDGLLLAQKYRLPPEIQQIIVQHHGDTPVMFFYHKALQMADGRPVDIADFRYDGERPSMKESAIIMLADTIEAAVRAMPDPTPQAIERFIERLVRGKIEDGQLSNSPLSLRDIDGIAEAFVTVLNGVFHERIEYPTVEMPARAAASVQPVAEAAPVQPAAEAVTAAAETVPVAEAAPVQPEAEAVPVEENATEPSAEDKPVTEPAGPTDEATAGQPSEEEGDEA
ncbi:MAG: HDIG domain-containing protein [Clostridia bacterium]|nr:HDIG domain-containing protein [Clostridia bacterium]